MRTQRVGIFRMKSAKKVGGPEKIIFSITIYAKLEGVGVDNHDNLYEMQMGIHRRCKTKK